MDGVHVALLHRQEEEIPRQKCAKVSMRKGDRTWVFFHMGLVYFLLPSRKLTLCAHRSITPQSHSLIFPFEDKFIQSHRMRSTIATHPSVGLTCYILLFFRHTDVTHEGQAMALSILPGIVRCLNPGSRSMSFEVRLFLASWLSGTYFLSRKLSSPIWKMGLCCPSCGVTLKHK